MFRPTKHSTGAVLTNANGRQLQAPPAPEKSLHFSAFGDAPCMHSGSFNKAAGGKYMDVKTMKFEVGSKWQDGMCPQGGVVIFKPSDANKSNASTSSLFAREHNLFHALGSEDRCLGGANVFFKVSDSSEISNLPQIIEHNGECLLNQGSKNVTAHGKPFPEDKTQFNNSNAYNNCGLVEIDPNNVTAITDINECCDPTPTPTTYPGSQQSSASLKNPINLENIDIPEPTPTSTVI
jgi:hypothetical protein